MREDAEKDDWVFTHKFDYIHLRATFTCFDDPRVVMRKAFDYLNPGGWIEYWEGSIEVFSHDGTSHGTDIERWSQRQAGKRSISIDRDPPVEWIDGGPPGPPVEVND